MLLKTPFKRRYIPDKSDRTGSRKFRLFFMTLSIMALCITGNSNASELYIGTATVEITPKLPVALTGQFHLRIAHTAETPLTANIVVLESRDGEHSLDAVIMVSCDLLYISNKMLEMVRGSIKKKIPGLDVNKIFLNATHTHTAPVLENDSNSDFSFKYEFPKNWVLQVEDYIDFFVQEVSGAIVLPINLMS